MLEKMDIYRCTCDRCGQTLYVNVAEGMDPRGTAEVLGWFFRERLALCKDCQSKTVYEEADL